MARMTIYVTDDLKARIDEARERVNWSEVACKAFEIKLGELAAKRPKKEMIDVIERLRASKLKNDDERRLNGRNSGWRWATHHADYDQLRRVAALDAHTFCADALPQNSARNLAATALSPKREKADRGDIALFIKETFDGLGDSDEYLIGFIEGAKAVYEQVMEYV